MATHLPVAPKCVGHHTLSCPVLQQPPWWVVSWGWPQCLLHCAPSSWCPSCMSPPAGPLQFAAPRRGTVSEWKGKCASDWKWWVCFMRNGERSVLCCVQKRDEKEVLIHETESIVVCYHLVLWGKISKSKRERDRNQMIYPLRTRVMVEYLWSQVTSLLPLTQASKFPGSTMRLSITVWIFVTRLRTAACSAEVGDRSAFLLRRAWRIRVILDTETFNILSFYS